MLAVEEAEVGLLFRIRVTGRPAGEHPQERARDGDLLPSRWVDSASKPPYTILEAERLATGQSQGSSAGKGILS